MDLRRLARRKWLGIQWREWALVFVFYLLSGAAYHHSIYLASEGKEHPLPNILIDYSLKALYTAPIWWLLFRRWRSWPIWQKGLIHVLLLPIFAYTWQQTYYMICDHLGIMRLQDPYTWWDIYIPSLFYAMQFGIFHIYDFYVRLQAQHELELDLREAALQSELTALKAQLNPHFLYNTFNAISASVPPEQERTREMIAKLSDLFRYQLKGSRTTRVPLIDEIAFARKYLALEKERFGDRLRVHFEVEKNLEQIPIPPMILQPLVENAVKHGISPVIEGGDIRVSVRETGDLIRFEVSDSGAGLQRAGRPLRRGVGLANTQKRLEKIYGSKLYLEPIESGGTRAAFEIPKKYLFDGPNQNRMKHALESV